MPEIVIETRLISGTGLVRVPSGNDKRRYYSLVLDVIREPLAQSISFRYSPPRQRYATIVLLKDGYVLQEIPMDYKRRRIDFVLDVPGQTLIAVKCAYEGILTTFANLGNALLLPTISVTNLIADFPNLNLLWDEAQIVCEGSTALQVKLLADEYNRCNDASVDEKKPPPPPPPLPPVPPGTPIGSISPPYDAQDTVTVPNPIDAVEPGGLPQGERCSKYEVLVSCIPNGASVPLVTTRTVFGEIIDIGLVSGNAIDIGIICYGVAELPGNFCQANPTYVQCFGSSIGFQIETLTFTITPV